MNKRPLVLDAFAGPGGWDTGLRLAGYDGYVLGIEHDMAACRTAVAAGHPRVRADVASFPLAHLAGQVDGLIASPPCQAWSNAGKRDGFEDQAKVYERIAAFAGGRAPADVEWVDERSKLTAEPMRWAVALRPRWIALEQVPPVQELWEYTAILLRKLGYRTWTGILSAEEYGVPQTRRRAILTASLDGPVGRPVPSHQPYKAGRDVITEPDLFGDPLPPPVSMAQALGWGLPEQPCPVVMTARGRQTGHDVLRGSPWRHEWWKQQIAEGNWVSMAPAGVTSAMVDPRPAPAPAHTITGKGTAAWVMRSNYGTGGVAEDRGEREPDEPAATVTSKVKGAKWLLRNGNQPNAALRETDLPAPTVAFGHNASSIEWVGGKQQSTQVTVAEAGVLQSFPWDYPWQGNKTARYRQVGDAMPPLLAMHVLRPLLTQAGWRRSAA